MQQPTMIAEHTINLILGVMWVVALGTLVVASINFVRAMGRVRRARPLEGTSAYIIGAQIVRGAVLGIAVAIASLFFTTQALIGDFNLVANWFSYAFLVAVYLPVTARLYQTLMDMRDTHMIEHLPETVGTTVARRKPIQPRKEK